MDVTYRSPRQSQHYLRFVVIRSAILPPKHRIVMADGFSELQFGRDIGPTGTSVPRVRLKEMEVSKLHASVYWDGARQEWGVVDMGSKHGTFVKVPDGETCDSPDVQDTGIRISPPRVASLPRVLGHMHELTIGSTTFLVHIHKNGIPCEHCSPGKDEEIPLFATPKGPHSLKRSRTVADLDSLSNQSSAKSKNPREALSMLKRSLLTRHDAEAPRSSSTQPSSASGPSSSKPYVDRSARRRALHATSSVDAPGTSIVKTLLPNQAGKVQASFIASEPVTPRSSTPEIQPPPAPLSTTNVGYRLLMGQGWEPGTTLGILQDSEPSEGRTALVEPLQLASTTNRAGLGAQTTPDLPQGTVNRERDKLRRWQEARLSSR
ncbi:hypothetical protein ONZ45_g10329 [Pleurotus djamor]|nr:hypothetical protein ONZ45_g10329 [Pleurotus djamor]